MANNPPDGTPRIMARLAYANVDEAVLFLSQAFDFSERAAARMTDARGTVLTEMMFRDSKIMLGRSGAHGIQSPSLLGGYSQVLIVYVEAIDAHFERAKKAGATVISAPMDQFWGDRRYEVKDIEGHFWSFHEHLRDVSAEEMAEALGQLRSNA